jgi:hypothetical protein
MAKAELEILLNKLQGRITGSSKFYATNRYGRTVISNYPLHRNPKDLSAVQRATFSAFGECSKQAKAELSDPARHDYWQTQYDQYKRLANKNLNKANTIFFGPESPAVVQNKFYKTLRGFVMAHFSMLSSKNENNIVDE